MLSSYRFIGRVLASGRTLVAPTLLVSLMALTGATGCTSDAGEIVVVLQTDLSLPKDINTIRLEVFNEGVPKFKNDYERLGEAEGAPFLLPGTITLLGSEEPADTVRVVASARSGGKDGKLRIVREVFTTIPQQRTATLQMPLQFLCDDSGAFDSSGEVISNCPEGQTCLAGRCEDSTVDSSLLPEYSANDIYVPGTCLEVKICFNTNEPIADDEIDKTDCSIAGVGGVNIGLETEGEGICGGVGCFVALDGESSLGWQTREDGRVQLPGAVCDQLETGEVQKVVTAAVNDICPFKTFSVPTCGPWSAAGPGETVATATVLAGSQSSPVSVAIGNNTLFWANAGANNDTGSVKAVSFNGGETVTIAEGITPRDILFTPNGTLVWSVADAMGTTAGRIQKLAPGDGMQPQNVVTGLDNPDGLTFRNNQVYWTDFGPNGGIYQAGINSSTAVLLATGYYPVRIAVDDSYLYWTNEGVANVDPPGSVQRYPLAGGAVEDVGTDQSTPRGLVLDVGATGDATAVYWTNSAADGSIMRVDLSGTTPGAPEVVASGLKLPYGITVDGNFVYWTNRGDGTVVRIDKAVTGGTPEVIADGQFNPGTIQVDATSIYWINESTSGGADGALVRFPKPL